MKKKILVKAPALSLSGYGVNSRFILRALRQYEYLFDLYLLNIRWGSTGWISDVGEEREWIDNLIKKTIVYVRSGGSFDMSVQCTIPGEFEKIAPLNVGVTAGTETTKISPLWMEKCNTVIDKLVVVSKHTEFAFKNTRLVDSRTNQVVKCECPIDVVNYPVVVKDNSSTHLDLPNITTDFNFLVMSQWSGRKNLENTISWWVEEFKDKENFGLIIKTNFSNNSTADKMNTTQAITNILRKFPNKKCSVYLLHGELEESQLSSLYLHPTIKCLINLAHGEGFSLSAFEAACVGLPVMTVGWGGHLDFLVKDGKDMFCNVDFDILPIQENCIWDTVLERDSLWSFADKDSYKQKLAHFVENENKYKEIAKELKEWVLVEFDEKKMNKKLVESFCLNVDELENEIVVSE